jgi:hypothetical protein
MYQGGLARIYFLPFRGRNAQKAAWENCAELFGIREAEFNRLHRSANAVRGKMICAHRARRCVMPPQRRQRFSQPLTPGPSYTLPAQSFFR